MAFSAPIFIKLLISYQVFMSSLGAKFYPKLTNIFLYNMAPVKLEKGKAIPVQAWTDLEGYRSLRVLDFRTIGTWRWKCFHPSTLATFTPQEIFLLLISERSRFNVNENSTDTIGNRSRDLLTCIAVPKLTATAREHRCECAIFKSLIFA